MKEANINKLFLLLSV